MENFPVEIIENFLMCPLLSFKDVINVSLTCKTFYEIICNNNAVWKRKFFQRWPKLRNKLGNAKISYYQELRHVYKLKKQTREILESMAEKFYKRVELSNCDMEEWYDIIKEKDENMVYLISDLMDIVNTETQIDSINVVPLNTPGNLTQIYFATKVLRYIRQIYLAREWEKFISLPPERQLLEIGAVIIAQWGQPKTEINPEDIYNRFDELAELVKDTLRRDRPDHPIFKATKQQFELWRAEMRPENEWTPSECRKIIAAMVEVLFKDLDLKGYAHRGSPYNAPDENDLYLNMVFATKRGMAISLAIIFDAVGRRLGLRFEPITFPSHFLLRFCESQRPDGDWYYIDIFNGGKILRHGLCPHSPRTDRPRTKFPTTSSLEVLIRLANDLEHMARQAYSPSGRVTSLRSALELLQLVSPKDVPALVNLARLYMLHNFNTAPLEHFILNHEFDVPEQARGLVQMLRDYRPDPPEGPIEPVLRPPDVKFAVGMVMHHILFGYRCVIFNWDSVCMAAPDWQWRNNIESLRFKGNQPFYNVLVEDGSHRYVAQENLTPFFEPWPLHLNDEVGKHFSHYYQSHYVPNAQTDYNFPEDAAVRYQYHRAFTRAKEVLTPE